jgi:tetratricopeptide (TPR) repeat protein
MDRTAGAAAVRFPPSAPLGAPNAAPGPQRWAPWAFLVMIPAATAALLLLLLESPATGLAGAPPFRGPQPLRSSDTSRRVATTWSLATWAAAWGAGGAASAQPAASGGSPGAVVRLRDVEIPLLKAALTAATEGNFPLAEQLFTAYINQAPPEGLASGYSNRGNVRLSLRKPEEAYTDFTEAMRLAPGAPVPVLNRALALEAMGRLAEGIADCRRAIELDPNESASYFNKGNMEAELGDYRPALDSYTVSADLSPGIPGYRSRQAFALNELGAKPEATRLLNSILRKNPQFLEARLALSSVYWSQGRAAEAEQAFFDAGRYEPQVESWGPAEAEAFATRSAWSRRFPRLAAEWLAFVAHVPASPSAP